jgi:hypothetical protein
MRLFILCTPRTGNTWLRLLLSDLLQLPGKAVHNPEEVPWGSLLPDCMYSGHWPRVPSFEEQLRQHGFRVIVCMRHPLDVLVSILHFATANQSSQRWLEGLEGDERPIYGAMPGSRAFRAYAAGPRVQALFSVSRDWASLPGVQVVRYEDLLSDTPGRLQHLLASLDATPQRPIAEVVQKHQFAELRSRDRSAFHFWRGMAGGWRHFLTAEQARGLAAPHTDVFAHFGYSVDPDPTLDEETAERRWIEMGGREWAEGLHSIPARQAETNRLDAEYHLMYQKYEDAAREKRRLEQQLAEIDYEALELGQRVLRLNAKLPAFTKPFKPALRWLLKRAA